jgi:hypothetical protein
MMKFSDTTFWQLPLDICIALKEFNRIGGVMFSVLVWSAVVRGFESWSGETNDNTFGVCCFSVKHACNTKEKECILVGSESG